MGERGDEGYINKFPDDAAVIAQIVRQADEETAVYLLQLWGSKQRDIGSLNAIQRAKEILHAQG